jgi:hypothetical protein
MSPWARAQALRSPAPQNGGSDFLYNCFAIILFQGKIQCFAPRAAQSLSSSPRGHLSKISLYPKVILFHGAYLPVL